jgi:very-short-patch-repair endonuclease
VGGAKQSMTGIDLPTLWREDPEKAPSIRERARARVLRRRQTEPEKKSWWHLRHRVPVEGTHFRRQVPIGSYVADFCCLKAKLIVEVDGNQHGYEQNIVRDTQRTAYLASQGYTVLRVSNREVMTTIERVLEAIYAQLRSSSLSAPPTPNPSPPSGRLRPSSTGYRGGEQRGVSG